MSNIVTLKFDLNFSGDTESIRTLTKLTQNTDITPLMSSNRRLNNRSWRLFHCQQKSQQKGSDCFCGLNQSTLLPEDLNHQVVFEKLPLALTETTTTLFSHSSNLSLGKHTDGSSHSSMANIDEEASEFDYSDLNSDDDRNEPINAPTNNMVSSDKPKEGNKNIFFIENSPSPPKPNGDNINLVRQDSLFGNQINIKKYSPSDISDDGIDDSDDSISDYSDEEDDGEYGDKEDENGVSEYSGANAQGSNKTSSKKTDLEILQESVTTEDERRSRGRSDDSEWMSVSSEDDKDVELQPINFSKRSPRPPNPRQILTDTITFNTENETTPSVTKPRSLLSGLFLNEMAKNHELVKEKMKMNSTSGATSLSNTSPKFTKPILKRSSTTGIITIGQDSASDSKVKIKRPSIIFQKNCPSMTDISKNYPHYKNKLIQNTILNDGTNVEGTNELDDDYKLIGKQKSIVGVSDFNVTTTIDYSDSLSPHQPSILSTSLTKYSLPSNNSFKNMLSKSSLNLTTIFGNKKHYKTNNNSNEKFKKSSSNSIRSASNSNSNSNSNFLDLKSSQDLKSSRTDDDLVDMKHQDIKSGSIDSCCSSTGDDENASLSGSHNIKIGSIEIKSVDKPKPMYSPKTTRKSMLDSELSKSLKDSIIIDHKLGKVPLPSKIVNKMDIRKIDIEVEDFAVDDYHSKGW